MAESPPQSESHVSVEPSIEKNQGLGLLIQDTTPSGTIPAPAIVIDPSVNDKTEIDDLRISPAPYDPSEAPVIPSVIAEDLLSGESEKGNEEVSNETTPCDPITEGPTVGIDLSENKAVDTSPSETVTAPPAIGIDPSENVADDSLHVEDENGDGELMDGFEKDVYKLCLEQAELEALGGVGEGEDSKTEQRDGVNGNVGWSYGEEIENSGFEGVRDVHWEHLNEDKNGIYSSMHVVEENDEIVEEQLGEGSRGEGRINNSSNIRRRVSYPMRPDAEDCAYYMKFGNCKFGLNCKFNHPPKRKSQITREKPRQREDSSERSEQSECKYYLTAGGCKYGKDCKYSHVSDRSSVLYNAELNFLGLPIRLGERECPYYMRTGSCKYGSNCRFHHPDPTTVGGGGDSSGYGNGNGNGPHLVSSPSISSWSSPRGLNETSQFIPQTFPPAQAGPTQPGWNGYQAPAYQTSERSLPTPPAFAMSNLANEIRFPMQHQVVDEYPERPGEPECNFFLRTGDCKYRSSCKFHHPKNRFSKPKANNPNAFSLSDKGLPLRPDQPICAHYHQYGICKYGPACKYDHPSKFGILPPPPSYDQQQFSNSNKWG